MSECGVENCAVTRPHGHCACGEPCEVGAEECDFCWAWEEDDRFWPEGQRTGELR
jgi:hypothetical protein